MRPEAIAELLGTLIRNRCINDGSPDSGSEFRSVETLADFFGEAGRVFEPHPGRQSVLYKVPGKDPKAPRLMLMGHLDVVPAESIGWDHDPFDGGVHDGFVWGRGAVDMLNITATICFSAWQTRKLERSTEPTTSPRITGTRSPAITSSTRSPTRLSN